jgi:hypothetical protein
MIARLEALLARVRARAAEPRPTAARTAPSAAAATAAPVATKAAPVKAPAAATRTSDHPSIVDDDEISEWPTRPPPAAARPADTDVELAAVDGREHGRVVVGAPAEEAADKAFESRERLVVAEPIGAEEAVDEPTLERSVPLVASSPAVAPEDMASAPEVEAVIEDAAIDEAAIEEAVAQEAAAAEESPASSRRPVAPEPEERIAQIAFGAEEPRAPLHTPPPESGRLPAAAVADFDADVTGVRDAPAMPPAAAHARELAPEVTRAKLPPGDSVAEAIGEAQRFTPGTFVALLDASLAL